VLSRNQAAWSGWPGHLNLLEKVHWGQYLLRYKDLSRTKETDDRRKNEYEKRKRAVLSLLISLVCGFSSIVILVWYCSVILISRFRRCFLGIVHYLKVSALPSKHQAILLEQLFTHQSLLFFNEVIYQNLLLIVYKKHIIRVMRLQVSLALMYLYRVSIV